MNADVGLRQGYNRANRLAVMHQLERFVNAVKRHFERNEGIDVNFPSHVLLDHSRQFRPSLHAAECGTTPPTLPFSPRVV